MSLRALSFGADLGVTDDAVDAAESTSPEALAKEASAIRERILAVRTALAKRFVDRVKAISAMITSAAAGEPLLLVGPPGTAKSELVSTFMEAIHVPRMDYFRYTLSAATEPAELFGPFDIIEMRKHGRYVRVVTGKLPVARAAFLDEIFNASSMILESLLTLINERLYFQGGQVVPSRLRLLFAATNRLPATDETWAFRDRFPLKVRVDYVDEKDMDALLQMILTHKAERARRQTVWAKASATLADFVKANLILTMAMGHGTAAERAVFPEDLYLKMRHLLAAMGRSPGLSGGADLVPISPRRFGQIYKLIRMHAWIERGGPVQLDDLSLLAYLGDTDEQLEMLRAEIPKHLGL